MTFHCLGALDTIRLISVDLRISMYRVLHVLFDLPLTCLPLNGKKKYFFSFRFSLGNSTRLDSTSVLGKSRYYLLQFCFIYPYLSPIYNVHVNVSHYITTIYLYLA